ncbi:hypothetical protein DFJ58DRAFT_267142 [Suillus subalutaceus]|uniref:uncharacterized protein n=1 Tax=Suillus subalutaceus TaxID=48586 RepID=UPI001B86DCEF|nr:uncharacterized protein DFJ58DRAFT_267142 [Suillus subalutaceus]KAG1830709.1 hypothetical protein DFJ58DRAFT_267142 [Suillus subalutaceus]
MVFIQLAAFITSLISYSMFSHENPPSLIQEGFPSRARAPPPPIPHATRPPPSPYMSLPPPHPLMSRRPPRPPPMPVPQIVSNSFNVQPSSRNNTLMHTLTLKFILTGTGITNILIRLLPYLSLFVAPPRSSSVSRHPPSLRPTHFSTQSVRKICTAHVLHNIYVRQRLTQVPQVMVSDRA